MIRFLSKGKKNNKVKINFFMKYSLEKALIKYGR